MATNFAIRTLGRNGKEDDKWQSPACRARCAKAATSWRCCATPGSACTSIPVVASEFSNWRDEQRAWRDTAVLFDQSHHMDELTVEGPDAAKLLEGLAVNSFANFATSRAKHFVPVSPDGYVIGDMIIFRETENKFILVGRAPTANWIEFNASLGKHDVKLSRDPRSPSRPDGKKVDRVHYRYQIQGPDAPKVLEKLNGGPVPDIKFFHVDWINVAGRKMRALRHGMAGAPGLEIWGPYAEKDEVHAADPRCRRQGRRRSGAGGCARLLHQHAGVGLDPVAACPPSTAAMRWPPTASGCRPQGYEATVLDRRQLRLQGHPRLLHLALRAGLRHVHQVRPRLRRAARRWRRCRASRTASG